MMFCQIALDKKNQGIIIFYFISINNIYIGVVNLHALVRAFQTGPYFVSTVVSKPLRKHYEQHNTIKHLYLCILISGHSIKPQFICLHVPCDIIIRQVLISIYIASIILRKVPLCAQAKTRGSCHVDQYTSLIVKRPRLMLKCTHYSGSEFCLICLQIYFANNM